MGSHDAHFLKGKGKSKSKKRNWLDANAAWKGKGKSKTGSQRPSVNAYNSEVFYGLEMKTSMDLNSTESSTIGKPGNALLDCGATTSAGPEASVQGLIHSILAVDKGATVSIARYKRPFFRFGNGKWGHRADFDKTNMVAVLLGMDHLSGREARESAMTIGFHTGLALESLNPNPEVFQLPSNSKGHYVRDIVYCLTKGFTNLHGTPTIHVLDGALQSAELQTWNFIQLSTITMT